MLATTAEAAAILFAQHYAERREEFDPAAMDDLRRYYTEAQCTEILAYLRAITLGNLTGNTLDALLGRLHPPAPRHADSVRLGEAAPSGAARGGEARCKARGHRGHPRPPWTPRHDPADAAVGSDDRERAPLPLVGPAEVRCAACGCSSGDVISGRSTAGSGSTPQFREEIMLAAAGADSSRQCSFAHREWAGPWGSPRRSSPRWRTSTSPRSTSGGGRPSRGRRRTRATTSATVPGRRGSQLPPLLRRPGASGHRAGRAHDVLAQRDQQQRGRLARAPAA